VFALRNFFRIPRNWKNPIRAIQEFWKSTKKEYKTYYLVVASILVLTLANQSIMQYALAKQRDAALLVNISGRQRSLSQQLINELYSCHYHDCDFSDLRLSWNTLVNTHEALQTGNERLGLPPLNDEHIQKEFDELTPVLNRMAEQIGDLKRTDEVNFDLLRADTDQFIVIMDGIVTDFQLKSEKDIRTIRLIELQLAVFSILIVFFEIFFIVIPILRHNEGQSSKLRQIAWHQSHAFTSHMKNIRDLEYVLKVEKKPERRDEIYRFIQEELEALEKVSKHMKEALNSKDTTPERSSKLLWNKVEQILVKTGLVDGNLGFIRDDTALSE